MDINEFIAAHPEYVSGSTIKIPAGTTITFDGMAAAKFDSEGTGTIGHPDYDPVKAAAGIDWDAVDAEQDEFDEMDRQAEVRARAIANPHPALTRPDTPFADQVLGRTTQRTDTPSPADLARMHRCPLYMHADRIPDVADRYPEFRCHFTAENMNANHTHYTVLGGERITWS
jgi:hypothetical protein